MIHVPGYKIVRELDSPSDFRYYEGFKKEDGKKVIILHTLTFTKIVNVKDMEKEGTPFLFKPIDVKYSNGHTYIIYEYFHFDSTLASLIRKKELSISQIIFVSIQLASLLVKMHQHQSLIGSFNPSNIFVRLTDHKLFITSINGAMRQTEQHLILYSSPELTGRMGKKADSRSDLYSLGAVLYEMLTGQLPFPKGDLVEIVHSHFTKIPTPPCEVNSQIPKQLSRITDKLLEKSSVMRYPTAYSLLMDLERCRVEWETDGTISNFPLGLDHSVKIVREKQLFGREHEIQKLLTIFYNVEGGSTEIVHINGNSGSGKTALVNEFIQICEKNEVIFATGKWDQYERNIPYGPIIQAWKTIFRTIVSQGDQAILKWRNLFLNKLGHRCQILSDLMPEFNWIIGQQIFDEKIGALERHNSILITFQQFLSVLTEEFTVVIFIDDIQWADQPTLELLRYLAKDREIAKLLVILASRDEKEQSVKSLHNLQLVQDINGQRIYVSPLNHKGVSEWLFHRYHFQGDYSSLTTYIQNLSQGNPFLLQQILLTMEKERYISFNNEKNCFEFYISRFPKKIIGKNIVDHIRNKLTNLSLQTTKTLKIAACLGTNCTFSELIQVSKTTRNDLLRDLYLLIDEGYLCFSRLQNLENDIVLEFIHDKVQQAVYTSMNKEEQTLFHYQIGLSKWEEIFKLDKPSHLFQLTDHLNLSMSMLDEGQIEELTELNEKAGQLAKNAAGFDMAYQYFLQAKDLLKPGHWEENYELSYRIFTGLGECAYLNNDFEIAEQSFEILLENAKTNKEKMSTYNLKLVMYHHLSKYKDAVKSGTSGLKLFGWKLDRPIGKLTIVKELLLIQLSIFNKKPEDFLQLPPMKDEENHLILESLISMNAPSYLVNQNLATYLMLRAFRFTLKHGDTDISALVYNNYALILSAGFGNFDKSYQYGKLALAHVEKSQVKKLKARVYFVFGSFVNHWKNSISSSLDLLQKSQTLSLEAGNFGLAGATSSFIIVTRIIKGEPIEIVLQEINFQLAFANKIQYYLSMKFLLEAKEWFQWLSDVQTPPPTKLEDLSEDKSAFIMHFTLRLQMSYIVGDEVRAKEIIHALNSAVTNTLVLVIAPEFYFYHTLWLCRFFPNESTREQKKMRKLLKRNLGKMEKWAKQVPINYEHKYLLMKTETENLFNSKKLDASIYELALEKAIVNGFEQDAAIICECVARYHQEKNLLRLSEFYVKEAYRFYKHWGAGRKLSILSSEYPYLLVHQYDSHDLEHGLNVLDLEAVIKASQTLSGEIVLEHLIHKVTHIVIENAGATNGFLLLKDGEKFKIAGELDGQNDDNKQFPFQLIQYVEKSHEPIILHEASIKGLFKSDPYIQTNQIMSLMAVPLLHQSQMIGILYLENHLLPYAYTERDLLLVSTIASQAAISIQNALLYMNLEEKVKARTEELEMVNKDLAAVNEELADAQRVRMELLSNISHDLRNPITSIQGYIEAMLDGIVIAPDKQMTYLKRSKEKLTGLNRLIQDLFELSRLQYGNMTFVKEFVNVEKLFHHLCDLHEWDIRQSGLIFSRIIEGTGLNKPLVSVDVGRIEQVVTNIVSNALKHTDNGSIMIKLQTGPSEATFSISDTGVGISPSDLERIFERSFTGKTNSYLAGNGLGLSISKEIVHHHDGAIWAESFLGKGTTIFFTLPIIEIEDEMFEEIEELNEKQSLFS